MSRLTRASLSKPDPFWQAYKETLDSLLLLNKKFPFKSRLPIFKLYTEISKLPESVDTELILYRLTILKELISRGLEPEHKNNKYI